MAPKKNVKNPALQKPEYDLKTKLPEHVKKVGDFGGENLQFGSTSILNEDGIVEPVDENPNKEGEENTNSPRDRDDRAKDEKSPQKSESDDTVEKLSSEDDDEKTPKSRSKKDFEDREVSSMKTRKRRAEKYSKSGKKLLSGVKGPKKDKPTKRAKTMEYAESSKNVKKAKSDILRSFKSMTTEDKIKFGVQSMITKLTPEEQEIVEKKAVWNKEIRVEAAKRGMNIEDFELDHMIMYCIERNPEVSYSFAFLEGLRCAMAQNSMKMMDDLQKLLSTGFSQMKQNNESVNNLKQTIETLNTIATSLSIRTLDDRPSKRAAQPREVGIGKQPLFRKPRSTAELRALAGKESQIEETDEDEESEEEDRKKKKKVVLSKKTKEDKNKASQKGKQKKVYVLSESDEENSNNETADSNSDGDDTEGEGEKEFDDWDVEDFLEILDSEPFEISCAVDVDESELDLEFLKEIFCTIEEDDWKRAAKNDNALRSLRQRVFGQVKVAMKLKKKEEGKKVEKITKKSMKPKK